MATFEDEPMVPTFNVVREELSSECGLLSQPANVEGCDPIVALGFMPPVEGAVKGAMQPAVLVCHGLRRMTEAEASHAALVCRHSPNGMTCNMEVKLVTPVDESLN